MRFGHRLVLSLSIVLSILFFYTTTITPSAPITFFLLADHANSGYLDHVIETAGDAGLGRSRSSSKWTVLWSHRYPFSNKTELGAELKRLELGRRVNKMPGSGWLSSKQALAEIKSKFIPLAFTLPEHYDEFIDARIVADDNTYWLVKSGQHRQIKVISDADLDERSLLKDKKPKFIQKMVSPPMLISGRKFDIGTYVVVTSAEPLRVYVLDEWLLRFCNTDYEPFDASNPKKYVVGDDYTPIWEVEEIGAHFNRSIGMKNALFSWMADNGLNPSTLETKVRHAVGEIWESQQSKMETVLKQYNNYPGQFFELLRMDWVLDRDANLFLLEVNMSPNLSSGHFAPNAQLYRYVMGSMWRLIGLPNPRLFDWEVTQCPPTTVDCANEKSRFCRECLTDAELAQLNQIVTEHHGSRSYYRATPDLTRSLKKESAYAQLQRAYLSMRCKSDRSWC